MSLVGAALWISGTLAFHVALASREYPYGIELRMTDAIALVNVLLSHGA